MLFRKNPKVVREEEIVCGIRAIVGIGNNNFQGLGLLYKKKDGSAGFMNVWTGEDEFKLIAFIDEGESRIVFNRVVYEGGRVEQLITKIFIR